MSDFQTGETVVTPSRGLGKVEHVDLVSGVTVRTPNGETWRYNPEQLTSTKDRPYQVGDSVRITKEGVPGEPARVEEGTVSEFQRILPDGHVTMWISVPEVPTGLGCIWVTDDYTTAVLSWERVELLEPASTNPSGGAVTSTTTPSDDTTPSLVALDENEAALERVRALADQWEASDARYEYDLPWAARRLREALDGVTR